MTTPRASSTSKPTSGVLSIKGSSRPKLANARMVGASESNETIRVSLYARQNPNTKMERGQVLDEYSLKLPRQLKYLDSQEFERVFGAHPDHLKHIATWASGKRLK